MRKEDRTPEASLPAFIPSTGLGKLSGKAISDVLDRFAQPRRLTHDLGFHKRRVTALATAFGGTCIVTGTSDGNVRLWDMVSGRCLRVFSCGGPTISGIFTTPGTNRMVTAFRFGNKKVWDLENGDCLVTLSDHPGDPVLCNDDHLFCKQNWNVRSFFRGKSPDSKRSEVLVYEVDTGKKVRTFRIENSHIEYLAVSPDGRKVAAVSDDQSVRIWDVASAELLHESLRRLKWPMIAGFSPDNRSIVVGWTDRVDVQDVTGSGTSFSIEIPSSGPRTYRPWYALRGYRLIENRLDLLSSDPVTYIRIIDIRTAQTLYTNTFTGAIQSESITEEGRFCLGFRHGWIDVWDMEHHELTTSLATDREYHGYAGGSNRIATADRRIVISREESVVHLIDPASTEPARTIPAGQPVRDILITPDGKGLLTMGDAAVKHWDLSSGRCLREFSIAEIEIWDDLSPGAPMMAITPDGKRLVLPSEGGVAIRDLSAGRDERGFSLGGQPGPFALYVTADGKRLMAVSGSTGFLASYDLEAGAPVAGFPLNGIGRFQAFCMGEHLLATADRRSLSLWDARTGRLLRTCDHKNYIDDILLAPSQREVIASGLNGFHFWDREGGEPLIEKPDNIDGVVTFGGCPSFLPGGRRFVVRGRHYIALWDRDTRQLLWRHDHLEENRIRKIAAFPDGERFATMDTTGVIQVRSVGTGEVLASLHILPGGFIWETPPDDHAPSGWLWTDREDLVSVSGGDRHAKTFRHPNAERKAYLKIYNNPKMVMARVEGRESYERQVELHARVLDTARVGNASRRRPAALTAGKKGDRK